MVGQRLSRELRRQPGIHRRLQLAGHVRGRTPRSRGAVRIVRGREPHRSGCAAAVSRDRQRGAGRRQQAGRRLRTAEPARARGVERESARRPLGRREGQPVVGVAPAAGGRRDSRDGEGTDRRHRERREHGQSGFRARCDRQQGRERARRALRLRGFHRPRRSGRGRVDQRVPLGRGRGVSVAQVAAVHGRSRRRALHEGHAGDEDLAARRGWLLRACGLRVRDEVPARRESRPDLAAPERVLRGRRLDLAPDRRPAQRLPRPVHQRGGRSDGRGGPHRLSPWGARLRAATPAAATAAAGAGRAEPSADRARALRAVHGVHREDVDGLGRGAGSGRRHAHLQVERARGCADHPVRAPDPVDGADGRRAGPRHDPRGRHQGRQRLGRGDDPGDQGSGQGSRLRGRAFRL